MNTVEWYHEQLLTSIKSISSDKRYLHSFLEILLTDREYDAIAHRLEILRALSLGHESQRTLAERLGVSIATVTRMSNMMKHDPERVKKVVTRLVSRR
jgi:TrpR family trp operon transcriptional repressor